MSNMNFNCDVCGREVFGCTFVNGMKFCAKCYQETFGETDKDRKIADLEAKLVEKDKEKNKMICHIGYDNLKYLMANNDWQILEAHQVKEYNQLRKANQDKISFAVEQLEKVKEFVIRQLFITTKDCNDLDEAEAKGCNELRKEIIKEIDNQIKELKGEKE